MTAHLDRLDNLEHLGKQVLLDKMDSLGTQVNRHKDNPAAA